MSLFSRPGPVTITAASILSLVAPKALAGQISREPESTKVVQLESEKPDLQTLHRLAEQRGRLLDTLGQMKRLGIDFRYESGLAHGADSYSVNFPATFFTDTNPVQFILVDALSAWHHIEKKHSLQLHPLPEGIASNQPVPKKLPLGLQRALGQTSDTVVVPFVLESMPRNGGVTIFSSPTFPKV